MNVIILEIRQNVNIEKRPDSVIKTRKAAEIVSHGVCKAHRGKMFFLGVRLSENPYFNLLAMTGYCFLRPFC